MGVNTLTGSKNLLQFLMQPDRWFPIYVRLVPYLENSAIIALSKTCWELSSLYRDNEKRLWDVNRSLSHYVRNPKRLRSELANIDALISGDFAMQFVYREITPATELLIIIGQETSAGTKDIDLTNLYAYLILEEGYKKVNETTNAQHGAFTQTSVWQPEGSSRFDVSHRIRVANYQGIDDTSSLASVLRELESTATATFITHKGAYVLYPKLTFHKGVNFYLKYDKQKALQSDRRSMNIFLKKEVGKDTHATPGSSDDRFVEFESLRFDHILRQPRVLSDKHVWTINLDIDGVEESQNLMPAYVFDATMFDVKPFISSAGMTWDIRVNITSFKHPSLQHIFLVPSSWELSPYTGLRFFSSWPWRLKSLLDDELRERLRRYIKKTCGQYLEAKRLLDGDFESQNSLGASDLRAPLSMGWIFRGKDDDTDRKVADWAHEWTDAYNKRIGEFQGYRGWM